jgi:hypothetical protein
MTPSDFKLQQREWGKLTRQAAGRADKVALTLWRRLSAVDLVDPMMVTTITAILTILRYLAALRSPFPPHRNELFRER